MGNLYFSIPLIKTRNFLRINQIKENLSEIFVIWYAETFCQGRQIPRTERLLFPGNSIGLHLATTEI